MKHLIDLYRIYFRTILIAMAVAVWFIVTLVLLKHLPIEVFVFWPVASFASFIWAVIK